MLDLASETETRTAEPEPPARGRGGWRPGAGRKPNRPTPALAAPDPDGNPPGPETRTARRLFDQLGPPLLAALEIQAGQRADELEGACSGPDPLDLGRGDLAGWLAGIRTLATDHARTCQRLAFGHALADGFGPLALDGAAAERAIALQAAGNVLRAFARRVGDPVERALSALAFQVRTTTAALAEVQADVLFDSADPVANWDRLRDNKSKEIELLAELDRLQAARDGFPAALAQRISPVIDRGGGVPLLAAAMVRASAAGALPEIQADPILQSLTQELAAAQVWVSDLRRAALAAGGAAPDDQAVHAQFVAPIAARIDERRAALEQVRAEAFDSLVGSFVPLIERAEAGDVASFTRLVEAATTTPGAFPAGLAPRLLDAAGAAFAAAGAVTFAAALDAVV